MLLALDVSGSMTWGQVAGIPGLMPRDASAALALVTAATEEEPEIVGFFTGTGGFRKRGRSLHAGYEDGLTPLSISPRQRLDDTVKAVSDLPFGGTDCALPMLYAQALEREIDMFVIYTARRRGPAPSTRSTRSATTAGHRASLRGSSWSGWSRTASRSPTRTTEGCSTSWASTPRRRS